MLPAPRGVSPVAASFLASLCQGIHHVPLSTCLSLHATCSLGACVSTLFFLFSFSLNSLSLAPVPDLACCLRCRQCQDPVTMQRMVLLVRSSLWVSIHNAVSAVFFTEKLCISNCQRTRGPKRARTADVLLAKQVLFQLSYGPIL